MVELIGAAKGLFSWLNRCGVGKGGTHGCWAHPVAGAELSALLPRYLFSTLNDFSASRDIILLCARLAEVLQAVGARGALSRAPKPLSNGAGRRDGARGDMWGELPLGSPLAGKGGADPSRSALRFVPPPQDCSAVERNGQILLIVSVG